MRDGRLGFIDTPAQGNRRPSDVLWCADNGCFGKGWPGYDKWLGWLAKHSWDTALCAFATAPDVVGDAASTLARSTPWLSRIRDAGYPAALVGQDGLENLDVPWDDFDAFFVGGGTEWKLGPAALELSLEARRRGKWVHVGRVNSRKRFRYCRDVMRADSVDGTFLVFGPQVNLPKLLSWVDETPPF